MRSVWSCSSCAQLLFLSLLGSDASVAAAAWGASGPWWGEADSEEEERRWEAEEEMENLVHRIPKIAQVTPPPSLPFQRLARRDDEASCPTEHSLCPGELNGGCCPSQYACASDSCYATTAGPTTACGKSGYYACTNGEVGCCPVGYVCARGDCLAPAGVTYTDMQCPNDYYLCPSSLNYGCCRNGMGCAPRACYSTEPVTKTLVQTITTTADGSTVTTTHTTVTVTTPTPPAGLPANDDFVVKFIPTSVPKVPETTPSSSDGDGGGGLSTGAIGGIIGGVGALLVVVVVAAFLVIRRLKKVQNIIESSKRGSDSGGNKGPHSQFQGQMAEHYGRQLHSDVDESADPLMIGSRSRANTAAAHPGLFDPSQSRAYSDSAGYPGTSAAPTPNPPYDQDPGVGGGYFSPDSVSAAAAPMPAHVRGGSMDSANTQHDPYYQQQQQQQQQGYPSGYRPQHHHWRQQSNASELFADNSEHGIGNGGVTHPLMRGYKAATATGAPASGCTEALPELDGSSHYPSELQGTESVRGGRVYGFGQGRGGYAPLATHRSPPPSHSRSSSAASVRGGHVRQGSDGTGYAVGVGGGSGGGGGGAGGGRGGGGRGGYIPVPGGPEAETEAEAGPEPAPEPGVGRMAPNWGPVGAGAQPPPHAPAQGLPPLDEAAEAAEAAMHGFYGRPDQQAGQTAAGLGRGAGEGAGRGGT
ncbi:hypothetical protein VTJ83DRAFT_6850 [Remersonia thermophila]|uniref:Uncharacterized protein n=1 Tax=Remersonia thermophila TaxID=72144 RepID=A0ABR4D5V8_9PEZI